MKQYVRPVSYTHLDVYKRQVDTLLFEQNRKIQNYQEYIESNTQLVSINDRKNEIKKRLEDKVKQIKDEQSILCH